MDDGFIRQLDQARSISGIPYIINSGCRCKSQNKKIGGRQNSSHLKCLAADIKAEDGLSKFKIVSGLIESGFIRIGIYPWGVHVDADAEKPFPRIWIY